MTQDEMLSTLTRVIDEMIAEGYHYPNEWLCQLAEIEREMGGKDRFPDWEPDWNEEHESPQP